MAKMRAYFRLDLYFFEHPKIVDLSHAAIVLYVAGIAYSNRRETDGFIARPVVRRLIDLDEQTEQTVWEVADELVKAGLWEQARPGFVQTDTKPRPPDGPEGFWIHDFLDHNESNEERAQRRDKDAARKRHERGSDAKPAGWHPSKGRPGNVQPDTTGRPDGQDAVSEPVRPIAVAVTEAVTEEVPPSADANPATVAVIPTAQTLVAAYVDAYRSRAGHDPPSRVKGQLARELSRLIGDGLPTDAIKAGLVAWFERDQHPSTLASFVEVEARGGTPRTRPTRAQQQRDQMTETHHALQAWAEGGDSNGQDPMGRHRRPAQRELPRSGATP